MERRKGALIECDGGAGGDFRSMRTTVSQRQHPHFLLCCTASITQ